MGILRARHDIEQDTEILTRYWHKKKDAWQNIFKCECCACPPLFLTSSVNGLITLLYYFAIFLCLQSILKILFCLKTDIGFQKNVRSRVLKREWVGDWSFLVTAFHTVDGCVVVVYGYMYQCVCIEKKTFDIRKRKLTPTGENRSFSIL